MAYEFDTFKTRVEDGVLFAAIASPPLNLIGPEFISDLLALMDQLDTDDAINVVVFSSAVPEFFIAHVDVARIPEYSKATAKLTGSLSGSLGGVFRRLSEIRQITIAQVEGYARGAGSEFALACDMRFAARESAVFCQIEAGFGAVPGAGAVQHLTRLLGRGRAMEVILSSGDFDADTAERYGWINRAMPQAELAGFVSALALRVAKFPVSGLTANKRRINDITLPAFADVRTDAALFPQTISGQRGKERTKELFDAGMQTLGDVERDFAGAIGRLKS